MKFREPKDSENLVWTEHVKEKMRFYYLSETKLKNILRNPEREEKGIATHTVAVMQSVKSKRQNREIWLMYRTIKFKTPLPGSKSGKLKEKRQKIIIISAWRYPGTSPIGEPPIPQDVIEYLKTYE